MKSSAPPVEGQQWFNTEFSSWDQLHGRTVVLVFWALTDEASLARLQQVESLTHRHDDMTAIGIHTPRVLFEDNVDNLRSVMAQRKITMPVVHDPEYQAWNRYNPEGWPTTVVISDRSTVIGAQAGVDYFETVEEAVWLAVNLAKQDRAGEPAPAGLPTVVPDLQLSSSQLAFPTCVRNIGNDKIAVVDSGNDRVFIAQWRPERDALVVESIVGGFDRPQEVAVTPGDADDSNIYVAEPARGSVTRCNLVSGERYTLCEELLRPSGLTIDLDGSLVVADSAAEQLLRITKPGANGQIEIGPIAGTGQTGGEDGVSGSATLCQPVALQRTEVGLVFCEAAGSSVRLLTDSGKITTIIGEDSEWGYVDGPAHQVRLQSPSDLAIMNDGSIIIVDTGNNRLRRLSNRRVKTVGPDNLSRPTSACVTDSGHLLVADTGHSRILVGDPNLGDWTPLRIEGLDETAPVASSRRAPLPKAVESKVAGFAGHEVAVEFPAPSSGPWIVSVQAQPSSLLDMPVSVTRQHSADEITLRLGTPGLGHLIVRSELERDSTINKTTHTALEVLASSKQSA